MAEPPGTPTAPFSATTGQPRRWPHSPADSASWSATSTNPRADVVPDNVLGGPPPVEISVHLPPPALPSSGSHHSSSPVGTSGSRNGRFRWTGPLPAPDRAAEQARQT